MCSDEIKSKAVKATIEEMDQLGMTNSIKLNWIKAHNGHAMNEIADSLAREGSAAFGPHSQIPIPDSHIKTIIDNETLKRWNAGWLHLGPSGVF